MLVLVVGPSGAGKDTLLDAARAALDDDHAIPFRPPRHHPPGRGRRRGPRGGDTEQSSPTRRFALSWQAHGLRYGIPDDIEADLAVGRVVVANVSRGVIGAAAARFPVRVIEITAPPEVLAARLAARGREDAADIAAATRARRCRCRMAYRPKRCMNDGSVRNGAARFLAALSRAASAARR